MRSTSKPELLTLTDSPGCFWLFGGFFLIIGGAAVAAVSASRGDGSPLWQVVLGIAMGLLGAAVGVLVIYRSPQSRVIINAHERSLSVTRRGLLRREQERFDLRDIRKAYLVQGKDIDGDPVFALRMQLHDEREIPLTRLWLHNRERLEANLAQLEAYRPRGELKTE